MFNHEPPLFNRDLSWLGFNYRVLQEAASENVPLYERIRFLSIFSSNMDEFFRVRMPEILTLSHLGMASCEAIGLDTEAIHLADHVKQVVTKYFVEYGEILRTGILPALEKKGIHLYYDEPLAKGHINFVRDYFYARILSFIKPLWLEAGNKTIFLENNALYLLVSVRHPDSPTLIQYAAVSIPTGDLPRYIELPGEDNKRHILFLDDAIRYNLEGVFPGYEVLSCYSIKMTRDAELNLEDEFIGDLAAKIEGSLASRDMGLPSRFLFELNMPYVLRRFLAHYFNLSSEEMIEGGRYHNLKDFASLPLPPDPESVYSPFPPIPLAGLNPELSILENMMLKDHLLHLPYHSYNPLLRFFNEAANHPEVEEIYITVYRVAANSLIANALMNAAQNGKRVTVFVELKARFDEANNLKWSKKLKSAGVRIVNSIPNLKVHAKVALVKKKSGFRWQYFGLLATGNFNENTARFYTDHVLLTMNREITMELELLFAYLSNRQQPDAYPFVRFKKLLVPKFNLVNRFREMIQREMDWVKQGKEGYIIIKMNNLQEISMIEMLYEASRAGVKIDLIIRGICCIVPGISGWSENIRVIRLVDRFLEHTRVFYFHNNGQEEYYMGSADWMNRNIHRRIEVCFPLDEPALKAQIKEMLSLQLADNTNAVFINSELKNIRPPFTGNLVLVNAQQSMYRFVKSLL